MEERQVTLNVVTRMTKSYFQVWHPEGMVRINTPSCSSLALIHFRVGPATWLIPFSGEQYFCYVNKLLMHHFFLLTKERISRGNSWKASEMFWVYLKAKSSNCSNEEIAMRQSHVKTHQVLCLSKLRFSLMSSRASVIPYALETRASFSCSFFHLRGQPQDVMVQLRECK